MKKLIVFLLLTIVIPNESIRSQEIKFISKQKVMDIVHSNNATIKISERNFDMAQADFRQTNAVLLPNISVSHTGIATTNPLMAFGSKLNQGILTPNDFDPNLLNNLTRLKILLLKLKFNNLL